MYNVKVFFLSVATFAAASIAQTSTLFPDPACSSSRSAIIAAAPTIPPNVNSALLDISPNGADPAGGDLLLNPASYVSSLCSVAGKLPSPVLSNFGAYGSALLEFVATEIDSYDGVITKCIATGEQGASITSYIHSIASYPGELCKAQSTPSNGTASITPYPTPTSNGTATTSAGLPTSSISLAGATMPTGIFAGAAAVGGLLGAVALL